MDYILFYTTFICNLNLKIIIQTLGDRIKPQRSRYDFKVIDNIAVSFRIKPFYVEFFILDNIN